MNPSTHQVWSLGRGGELALDRPRVMAIINVTPDSFSDGGLHLDPSAAARAAVRAQDAGADLLDIGGESTRPGAQAVGSEEQIRRVVPAIRAIREAGVTLPISVDTTLPSVARAAVELRDGAGATIINDVSGGSDPAMLDTVRELNVGVILMHRAVRPSDDVYSTEYAREPSYEGGVVRAVRSALAGMLDRATSAGIDPGKIVLDPGLGFGKSVEQNAALIAGTRALLELGCPILSGASRKSFVGRMSGAAEVGDRVAGSLAASVVHLRLGCRVFRVHDVAEQVRALKLAWVLEQTPGERGS